LYVTNNGTGNLTGVYLASGATSWTSTSDRRLKENIVNTSYGLKEIVRLSVKEYNFRTAAEKNKKIGLIAQEVFEVIPEIVEKGDDGEYKGDGNAMSDSSGFKSWGVDYAGLSPVLVKAVQELKTESDTLKARIEALEKENRELKGTNTNLQTEVVSLKTNQVSELDAVKKQLEEIKKVLGMEANAKKKE
jgi:hypothetical protein